MKASEFKDAIVEENAAHDFAVGDRFWLDDWKFEVVAKRDEQPCRIIRRIVCKWDVSVDDFLNSIFVLHPEIDAVEFFHEHENEIVEKYKEGIDCLLTNSMVDYAIVMKNAIESAVEKMKKKI
jgi:hypothetical protein